MMEVDVDYASDFENISKEHADFDKKCSKLAQDIVQEEITLVQIVERLGVFITSKDNDKRELGIWILSAILKELPPTILDDTQLQFVSIFYANRLKDTQQIIPAVLDGLLSIIKFNSFPNEMAPEIFALLFANVSCQQQQQHDRYVIYNIFSILLEKSSQEIISMGLEYVYGVMSSVDGERDPKNLMFLFGWYPKLLKVIDLKHLTEEMFEILSCYFPVDFKAPPQDPNSITRELLAGALAACLTAIPGFGEFCIPLALEKLDSSLQIAKCDSLKLLDLGCENFDVDPYEQHSNELWYKISKELASIPSPELKSLCISSLTAIIKKLEQSALLKSLVINIMDVNKRNLIPDSKMFVASSDILLSVARACRKAEELVTKEIAPILTNTYSITNNADQKSHILQVLTDLFVVHLQFNENVTSDELRSVPVLSLKALTDEHNNLIVTGFKSLGKLSPHLSSDHRTLLYKQMETVLTINLNADVEKSLTQCFIQLATDYPMEIENSFLRNTNADVDGCYTQSSAKCLHLLSSIAHLSYFTDKVIDRFLVSLFQSNKAHEILESWKRFVEKYAQNQEILDKLFVKRAIVNLTKSIQQREFDWNRHTFDIVRYVIKTIMHGQDCEKQRAIFGEASKTVFLDKHVQIPLLDALLIKIRKDVNDYLFLITTLDELLTSDDGTYRDIGLEVLANTVNKCNCESVFESWRQKWEDHWNDINQLDKLAWLTKALVLKNHPVGYEWTDKLIDLLSTGNKEVPTLLANILNDNCDSLSADSYCNISVLWQQKFFVFVTNKLSAKFQSDNHLYLLTLCYLFDYVSQKIVALQFKKLLKLVVITLEDCTDPKALQILLKKLNELTISKENCIEDNLPEILCRVLKLTRMKEGSGSLHVRILALQLIQAIASFPLYKILPHKNEVLSILGTCLDDEKRLVRKEAVHARMLWFLMDAPI